MTEGARGGEPEPVDSAHGWRVVGGTHAVVAATFGSAYAFSALFPGLSAEFQASRAEISLIFSAAAFTYYSLGALAGPLADRWPTRGLVLAGLVAMIVGYVGASRASSLLELDLWYAVGVGLGIGLSYVPAIGAVQSWFVQRRSQASGIATAGLGLGTLVLPYVVGHSIADVGWRACLVGLAVVAAVVGLPGALLIRRRVSVSPQARPSPLALLRDPRFRTFYVVLLLSSFSTFIPYVHIVPAAQDLGLSLESGTLLIGIIGVGNVFGRLVLAGLGDRIGRVRLLALLTFSVAASFMLWAAAGSIGGGFILLALFAVTFGMSYGGCVGLYPAVAADLFGTHAIGTILGYLYTAVGIAALLGPTLAGHIFDLTGSYLAPIVASAAAAGIAGALTFRLARRA
jgi:OFA family oxalate/formate antiporter-like MFS transporter